MTGPLEQRQSSPSPLRVGVGIGCLTIFVILLFGLPILARATGSFWMSFCDAFYRAGALVFGGGHVVLPLLHGAVVYPGWVSEEQFLAGYGAAQAVPGPLFTFAAYLGAVANGSGIAGSRRARPIGGALQPGTHFSYHRARRICARTIVLLSAGRLAHAAVDHRAPWGGRRSRVDTARHDLARPLSSNEIRTGKPA